MENEDLQLVSLKMKKDDWKEIQAIGKKTGISASLVVRLVIDNYLKNKKDIDGTINLI